MSLRLPLGAKKDDPMDKNDIPTYKEVKDILSFLATCNGSVSLDELIDAGYNYNHLVWLYYFNTGIQRSGSIVETPCIRFQHKLEDYSVEIYQEELKEFNNKLQ